MRTEEICVVYYSKLTEENMTEANLHENQKKLALDMLKQGFSDFFSVEFEESKFRREKGGKPYYADEKYYFNISHCKDVVVVALSWRPVGVDVEQMRSVKYGTVKKCCTETEQKYVIGDNLWHDGKSNVSDICIELSEEMCWRFLELWTRKESYVKFTGQGLRMEVNTIDFDVETWRKNGEDDVWSVLRYIEDFVVTVTYSGIHENLQNIVLYREY